MTMELKTSILAFIIIVVNAGNLNADVLTHKYKDFTGATKLQYHQPRHVHLAYGEDPTSQMVVTWSTLQDTGSSFVEYGVRVLGEQLAKGNSSKFVDDGKLHLEQYIHRVKLTDLIPGQTYMYHVGSDLGWSEIFYFKAMPNGNNWIPRLAIYGDLGNDNAQSLTMLQRETHLGIYDAIIHAGDFAYDLSTENGLVGDAFMEQIQPIAAYLPYMVCPGNHEWVGNFRHYKNRFSMPGEHQSMMYSWNMGPIHFISLSTEFYYFLQYGITPIMKQYKWLEKDLKEAQANRHIRPWIITYGHRPMYCSNQNTDDCTKQESLVRVGLPYLHWYGLEDLFMQYGVDLTIWAHEHSYERLLPVYNRKVYNGSFSEPYRNPKALVHIITGSAGCEEKHDDFPETKPDWTAFRSTDYGFTRLKALNFSHLYLEQVSMDQGGKVIDSFHLIRDKHEPYPLPPTQSEETNEIGID